MKTYSLNIIILTSLFYYSLNAIFEPLFYLESTLNSLNAVKENISNPKNIINAESINVLATLIAPLLAVKPQFFPIGGHWRTLLKKSDTGTPDDYLFSGKYWETMGRMSLDVKKLRNLEIQFQRKEDELETEQLPAKISEIQKELVRSKAEIHEFKRLLASNYKIHLMPRTLQDLENIVKIIVEQALRDENFGKSMHDFKIYNKANFNSLEVLRDSLKISDDPPLYHAIIVVYPASGKENAEYVLNTFIKIFKDIPGAGISPRYNIRVNDLIYYAQGDGDYKERFQEYYSQHKDANSPDGLVFYRKDFEGEEKDYSLHID